MQRSAADLEVEGEREDGGVGQRFEFLRGGNQRGRVGGQVVDGGEEGGLVAGDEQHVGGTINNYLANEATRIINSPEFQRVKDTLEGDLVTQEKKHIL